MVSGGQRMTLNISRTWLLNGATLIVCGTFAAMFFAGSASAQIFCRLDSAPSPDTFSCGDGGPDPVTATGTASDGAVRTEATQGLALTTHRHAERTDRHVNEL
jgi:hypothetical protein